MDFLNNNSKYGKNIVNYSKKKYILLLNSIKKNNL